MSSAEESVERRWRELTRNLPEDVVNSWWTIMLTNYKQDHRKYHKMAHLHRLFDLIDSVKPQLTNPDALYFAVLFQHLEYDPQSTDNEEANIKRFKEFAEQGNLQETDLCGEVVQLLGLASTHITEEHKSKELCGSEDKHYFLDLDVSYLGSLEAEYSEYAKQIREEYRFLSDTSYRMLRSKILKSFLQIPNIFGTKHFRDEYETRARNNIEKEIADLLN